VVVASPVWPTVVPVDPFPLELEPFVVDVEPFPVEFEPEIELPDVLELPPEILELLLEEEVVPCGVAFEEVDVLLSAPVVLA